MTPTKFSVGSHRLVNNTPPYLLTSPRGYLLLLTPEKFQLIFDALHIAASSSSTLQIPIQSLLEQFYRIHDEGLVDVEHYNAITSARHLKPYLDTC